MRPIRDYITKTKGGQFQVKSHEGKVLGTHKSRAEALQQLRAVEYHKAHDAPARMGSLELPGAGQEEYVGADIGTAPLDAVAQPSGNSTRPNITDPLQPHELPERHSNPHHSTDPMREPNGPNEHNGHELELRYLCAPLDALAQPSGAGTAIREQVPNAEDLASSRAELSAGLDAALDPVPRAGLTGGKRSIAGSMKREEYRAPFQPGGNGDPSPNPSKKQTIGATSSLSIAGGSEFPASEHDEGDPNQYEMLSTARKAPDLNEATEPGYGEVASPAQAAQASGPGWRDPSGDDDWLRAIGAMAAGGSEL